MSNHDDFWTTLAAGHTNTVLAGAMDSHLSGKSIEESFGSVRTLTDAHRQANALSLPEGRVRWRHGGTSLLRRHSSQGVVG
jgi:hypothetical protein